MPPQDHNIELGSWSGEDLSPTVLSSAGFGTDDSLPPEIRFLANVAKLIRRRDAIFKVNADPVAPAIFLLAPNVPEEVHKGMIRVPMLNNGNTQLNSRIWLVSGAVNCGYWIEAPQDDNVMFDLVTYSIGLGTSPAIIYEPRGETPTLRYYRAGMKYFDKCEIIPARGEEVSDLRIFSVIERVYQHCLITPDAQSIAGKLWEKAEHWWPAKNAEAVVQLNVKAGLVGHFLTCTIRAEQPTPGGRTDLEIEENDPIQPGTIIRHALIELKVLRSFHQGGSSIPPGFNLQWIESGVLQAHEYGIQKGSKLAALCCFDMRLTDDKEQCFDHVREKARTMRVVLKKWYLYSSSEFYRAAMAGQ